MKFDEISKFTKFDPVFFSWVALKTLSRTEQVYRIEAVAVPI